MGDKRKPELEIRSVGPRPAPRTVLLRESVGPRPMPQSLAPSPTRGSGADTNPPAPPKEDGANRK